MIAPTAIVENPNNLGSWTDVWHYSIICKGAVIGANCNIGSHVFIDKNVRIGRNCKIQNYACIYEGVEIGDGVLIGPHVCFTNDKYPRAINPNGTKQTKGDWTLIKTVVEDGASIGARTVIVCGVIIGQRAMIGSGSVVTQNIPSEMIAFGVPAIPKRSIYGRKNYNRL